MNGLDKELMAYYEEAEFPMVRHPLVYAVPFFDSPDYVAQLNKQLVSKKEAVEKALMEKEYNRYVFLHERAYRIEAFQEIAPGLTDQQYWPLLREIWTDSENIFQNAMQWWEMISSPRQRRALFTACDCRGVLKRMPAELTIYRGTTDREMEGHYLGFSWTISREKAEWFATRLLKEGQVPVVATATVRKKDIVGYIDGRGEQEIVVEPKDLQGLEWEDVR